MIYMYIILMIFICYSDIVFIFWIGIIGGVVSKFGFGGGVCVFCDFGFDR